MRMAAAGPVFLGSHGQHAMTEHMNRIKGKLILVTGASSGIGEACARRFAADGADLVLWARRAERLEQLAAELGTAHRISLSLAVVDVRDRTAVNRAAEALVGAGRVPDVLVNHPSRPTRPANS